MLARAQPVVDAVHLPVSAGLEAGYGIAPEDAAETVARVVALAAVGANIEDYTRVAASPLFEAKLAAERIRAIRQRADASGVPFTLTARTDAFLVGHPRPRTLHLYEASRQGSLRPAVEAGRRRPIDDDERAPQARARRTPRAGA